MKAKLIELPNPKGRPPHCCIVSGRRDGPLVDFGELTQKASGPGDPHVYLRTVVVEDAARDLLGMVRQVDVDALRAALSESEAKRERVEAILAGAEELSAAEDKLRAALGVSLEDPDDGTDDQEQE